MRTELQDLKSQHQLEHLEAQVEIVSRQHKICRQKQAALAELNRKKREALLGLSNELLTCSGLQEPEPQDPTGKAAGKRRMGTHLTVQACFNSDSNVTQQALKVKESSLSTGAKSKKSKLSVLGISSHSLKVTPRQEKNEACKNKVKELQVSIFC